MGHNEVVRDSADLDDTIDNDLYHDADPGVDEIQGGHGSASLRECLGRTEAHSTSPTCHSGEGLRDTRPLSADPSQAMNPNLDQTFPQDSATTHDPPQTDAYHQPKESECKEEGIPTPRPEQEQYDVEEEPESPRVGEEGTAQSSQFPQGRSSDPMQEAYYQDTSRGPCEAPWIYAMNELRCLQHSVAQLRKRVDEADDLRDLRGLREGQDDLSNRIGSRYLSFLENVM